MNLAGTPHLTVATATAVGSGGDWLSSVMQTLGAPGAGLLVALENLFPPIPSEVVLPLAGFLAHAGMLDLVAVLIWTTIGSVVGALALYGLGAELGRSRLEAVAERLPLVRADDVRRSDEWFARHGASSILLGRLVPMVRSLISIPAGVQRMPLLRFTLYTAIGSGVWNTVLVVAGYLLGRSWTLVEKYVGEFQWVVVAVVVVAVGWFVVHRVRSRRASGGERDRPAGDGGDAPGPGDSGATDPRPRR